LQASHGIRRTLGLHGKNLYSGSTGRNGCSADQATSAQWRDDQLQGWFLLKQLQGCSSLAGDDIGVVIRMDRDFSLSDKFFQFLFA